MLRYLRACVFAILVAGVATSGIEWQVNRGHLAQFRHQCERLAYRLDRMPAQSMAQGATTTLGSTQDAVRRLAEGRLPPGDPQVVALLRRFARSIGADNALVLDRAGAVVAEARDAASGAVHDLGTRPCFQSAIQGRSTLYPALDARSGERGIYVAAPVGEPGAAPVGVVVAKMGFEAVDELLREETGRFALVSPRGLVFAASDPAWLNRAGPGAGASGREPMAPPRETRRRVELPVQWMDPDGAWKLIGMPEPGQLFTGVDRALLGGILFLAAFLAAAAWLERRKRAEEDRRHQESLAEALRQGKRLAEEAAQAKAEFLANMSHEIRTPLNGVMGMLQVLEMSELDQDQQETVATAMLSANRLTMLLTDILDLSRIEAGMMSLREHVFEISQQVRSVMETFFLAAKEKGLRLDFHFEPDMPVSLVGDESRLRQILFNLVGNAIKFTEKGGVRVWATALRYPGRPGLRVLFTVKDTGIGITDDQLRIIFEPFSQADGSYTRRFQGAGLGLSIARKLVALMGGEICLESGQETGTTCYLSLPFGLAEQPAALAEPAQPEAERRSGPGLRVLVVEDDETNLTVARRMLEVLGHQTVAAMSGEGALIMLSQEDFDLLFMDIQLPGMNGVEAARVIRGSPGLGPKGQIPIIAMTAYAMSGDRENFLEAGLDDYIAKPVDFEELKAVIDRVMAKVKG